jgi:NodT family efflux transporter outer membrane factor (OMF) lipoprotein
MHHFSRTLASVAVLLLVAGCALQAPYSAPVPAAPAAWSATAGNSNIAPPVANWWTGLRDPAVDTLVANAVGGADASPTLLQALARIDEARAVLGQNAAARLPSVTANASFARLKSQEGNSVASPAIEFNSASAGPTLGWELDLFGRVRESVNSAQRLLAARTADADEARLTLAADIASQVLTLRACDYSRRVDEADIASREKTLVLTRLLLSSGFAARVDEARAASGLATARITLATQTETCSRDVNALVTLSGTTAAEVRRLTAAPAAATASTAAAPGTAAQPAEGVPLPPPLAVPPAAPALPAAVLARHPSVIAAEREVASAWADIGVARANRWPRIDLSAALTGQWLSAGGQSLHLNTWSLGPNLTAPLFDGGAGAAGVSAAEARYRTALANLRAVVRSTVEEVENALVASASAATRGGPADDAVAAARVTLVANEAQWRAGSLSLFELEDARRQFAAAQNNAIAAARDRGLAWVALVKATGNATTDISPSNPENRHE